LVVTDLLLISPMKSWEVKQKYCFSTALILSSRVG